MDTIITKRAYAKINLNLEIIKKRSDNYHEIESIFQRVSLYDELSISKIEENDLQPEKDQKDIFNNVDPYTTCVNCGFKQICRTTYSIK